MALIRCDFFSQALAFGTSMTVILPNAPNGKLSTLYLLHGLSDDHTTWTRRTSIERYAEAYSLAVVMPDAGRSFYTDMAHGYKYWTFISEELPHVARSYFPLSDERGKNFVAGLSMGGYGAFKLALSCPDKFAAGASLSGAVDFTDLIHRADETAGMRQEIENIFGEIDEVNGSSNDLFELAKRASESGKPAPKLYQCCGTEDFLYKGNLRFRDYAKSAGLPLTYEEGPGDHTWSFWDKYIQKVLEWLPLKD